MKTNIRLIAILAMAFALIQINLNATEQENLLPPIDLAQIKGPPMAAPQKKPAMMTTPKPATPAPKQQTQAWWTDFSVTPYVAWRNINFEGKPVFGSGLDLGYQINRSVGMHLLNSVYDEPDVWGFNKFGAPVVVKKNGWTSGTGIDETELVGRADLIQTGGKGNDRFVGFLLGSYTHSWEHDDEAIGVGAGFDIRLAKNFAIEASYRVRAFFNGGDEGCGMAGLHFQW